MPSSAKVHWETTLEHTRLFLKRLPTFAELSAESIDELVLMGVLRRFRKHEFALRQGDEVNSYCIIVKGLIRVFTQSRSGREYTLRVLGTGGTFGDGVLFSRSTADTFAQATMDSLVISFNRRDFCAFALRHPSVILKVGETVASRLLHVSNTILDVVAEPAELRVTRVLLGLCCEFGGLMPFGHQQIADMAGMTRQTATEVLANLTNQGVTRCLHGSIAILNKDKLRLMLAQA